MDICSETGGIIKTKWNLRVN